jgi:aspartate-semialdehyde dehydrogenase
MKSKIKVGILGATGTVGQRFIQLLEKHPWFEVAFLTGSDRSVAQPYGEVCRWKLPTPMPERVKKMKVLESLPGPKAAIAFSGLGGEMAGQIEEDFARSGYAVISNASAHRMGADIPLLIPEINPEHLDLIKIQQEKRKFRGYIVTNPNCSAITLSLALAPLDKAFGIKSLAVSTMQAISGAGYPGVASLDILGNIIPNIGSGSEEEKIETETKKIFGRYVKGFIEPHSMTISAQVNRVPVVEGHTESVFINFKKRASISKICEAIRSYTSLPQKLELPSAPAHPVVLKDEEDRPQPRLDVDLENGMATIVGRVRECNLFDAKFVILGHNTVRGAAGAALLNAELLHSQGYF